MAILAHDILRLLAAKHARDVFVSECKNGPTCNTEGLLKMDAWGMTRSWRHPCCFAYEIKVARADFLGDQKWPGYLDYCNEFSFVCPPKLIDPAELPDGVGLIWTSVNCKRLHTRRKAAYRDVQIPEDLFRYVLMCRTEIVQDGLPAQGTREYWHQWLKDRKLDANLGYHVGAALRQTIYERITEVEFANKNLRCENEQLAEVKAVCEELGIDSQRIWQVRHSVEQALSDANGAGLDRMIEAMIKQLRELRGKLPSAT